MKSLSSHLDSVRHSAPRRTISHRLLARLVRGVLLFLVGWNVAAGNAWGQAQSGTILGTVEDQSGSAISNAAVTVLNVGNGFSRGLMADSDGRYIADTIPTGTYSITAAAPGFAKLVRTGVELTLGSRLEINLVLSVGNVKEEIVVTTSTPLLQSQSSEVSNLVSNREVVDLPLNGRTFTSLVLLTPGAYAGSSDNLKSSPYALRGSTNISVNGSSPQNNSYLVDGIFNRNLWLSTLIMVPTVDSIQEFRVLTSNYSAEYGAAAGAVTLVETKAGSNEFHGDVYEFLRNDRLDANTFFNNRLGFNRPPFQRNEFGGIFGGPLIKNKTFFFADYQGIRLRDPQTIVSTVPTLAQRQMVLTGDFSALGTPIYDPASLHAGSGGTMVRDPFPGNQIPLNRIDPVSVELMRLLPDPINANPTLNFAFNPKVKQRTDQFDLRFDQNLGSSDRLFAKYSFDDTMAEFPGTLPVGNNPDNIPIGPYLSAGPSSGPTGGPPFEGGYSGISVPLRSQSFTINHVKVFSPTSINEARFGLIRLTQQNLPLGINFKTADAIGLSGININDLAGGLPAFFVPGFQTIGDDSSFPETSAMTIFQLQDNVTLTRRSHTIKFGGLFIRSRFNAFSDFPTRGEFSFNGQFTRQVNSTGSATALADFALGSPSLVSRNILTGEVGMRDYQLAGFAQDNWRINNRLTVDLGVRYELFAPPLEVDDRWANFDVTTGTLILAGKNGADRRLRNFDKNNFSPRVGLAYKLTSDGKTLMRGGYGISYVVAGQGGGQLYKNLPFFFAQSFPTDQNGLPVITLQNGVPVPTPPSNDPPGLSVGNPNVWDPDLQTPQMRQWSFGVQRELRNSLMLDVSYVGTDGVSLIENVNVNQAFPGPGAPGPRRPLFAINPNVTNVTVRGNFGESSYHSLQARLQQRFSASLTFTIAYTYSKYLSDTANINGGGNGPPQDARCVECEWGPMPEDRRHMVVINHEYALPFGTGRKFASRGVLGRIVGPWDFDGIWTIYSGSHFTPTLATSVSNAAGGGGDRPNQVCDANLSSDNRSINHWFDATCYSTPAQFTFGNARRGSLVGPNYFNVDLGLQRFFKFTERQKLLFRWEMFNAFNRANFSVPNAVIGSATVGQISNTSAPRIMQVALKYIF